ncbi:MAG: phospholipid carrier-dependent glycosyltransferase [Clostridiales bacterium]|jgi:hypothetical protein|nr:phospholipid carrier-dependent glycosyltransferase [Clostridiales bacterium]
MKKFNVKILLLFIIIFLTVFIGGCGTGVSIKNGSFENFKNSRINSWTVSDYEKNSTNDSDSVVAVEDGGYTGDKCLEISSEYENDIRIVQNLKVTPNTLYKISLMYRTEGISDTGNGLNISAVNAFETSSKISGDAAEWTLLEGYAKTGKSQKTLDLTIGIGGYGAESSGTAWIDDVSIEKVDSLPAGAAEFSVEPQTAANSTDASAKHPYEYVFQLIFGIALCGLIVFVISTAAKRDKINGKKNLPMSENPGKPKRKDWIIIIVMTAIYAVMAFSNLGDLQAASNYYKSKNSGESFIVDFDSVKTVSGVIFSCNEGNDNGSYGLYYENEETGEFEHFTDVKLPENTDGFFAWKFTEAVATTSKIKIQVATPKLSLNELGFMEKDGDGKYSVIPLHIEDGSDMTQDGDTKDLSNLFDEQDTIPETPSYMNGTYFDEIYFPSAAYDIIHGLNISEYTHPPLGKEILAIGIKIFGMDPFGWRCMGTLFGVMMLPFMYLFGLKIFKNRLLGFTTAFLMMFDFMHFTQTRLATIDSYATFFIILMYYYIYDYFVVKSYDLSFKKSIKPLIFCGISFGLGAATKWICLYAAAGLALLFFLAKYLEVDDILMGRHRLHPGGTAVDKTYNAEHDRKEWLLKNFLPTGLICILFFILIPGIIYVLSYIPYTYPSPDKTLFQIIIENQKFMFNFHSGLTASHPYGSPWYSWPVDARPIWYYCKDYLNGLRSSISSFGNPLIWWVGIPAIVYSVYCAYKTKNKSMLVIFVAFSMQYFPWILVTRVAFIYHYFSATPFLIIMIVYSIQQLMKKGVIAKSVVFVYLAAVLLMFILYFPVISGLPFNHNYIQNLRIFSSWVF